MSKILIIDSHKGSKNIEPVNLHFINSRILANYLKADLIWSYPEVNENIKTGYDVIIFVHASKYSYVDYEWVTKNPNAKLFYVTNEYNLGESYILWMAAKEGRKYSVIANHPNEASKVVMKYVENWNIVNLNVLSFLPKEEPTEVNNWLEFERSGCVYYGSYRKDRQKYYNKYLTKEITLSTYYKNIVKFGTIQSQIIPRINWTKRGLFNFKQSLYIEDESTHVYYNFLANRFYEALNYGCVPIFSIECQNTTKLSGYEISEEYFITESKQLLDKTDLKIPREWCDKASKEKEDVLKTIGEIVL